jgi:hypothetical protein
MFLNDCVKIKNCISRPGLDHRFGQTRVMSWLRQGGFGKSPASCLSESEFLAGFPKMPWRGER